jgi:hypothetical protein
VEEPVESNFLDFFSVNLKLQLQNESQMDPAMDRLLKRASRLSVASFPGGLGSLFNRGDPGCRPSAVIVEVKERLCAALSH